MFLRYETYGRAPRNSGKADAKPRATVDWLVQEALRDPEHPEAYAHLLREGMTPLAPVVLFGDPAAVVEQVKADAEHARDPIGRHVKRSAQLVVGAVVSHPEPLDALCRDARERELLGRYVRAWFEQSGKPAKSRVPESWDQAADWLHRSVRWLEEDMEDDRGRSRVKTAVVHVDEGHLHAHVWATAELDPQDRSMHLRQFFKPEQARDERRRHPVERVPGYDGERHNAYAEALKDALRRYHRDVGARFGYVEGYGDGSGRVSRPVALRLSRLQSRASRLSQDLTAAREEAEQERGRLHAELAVERERTRRLLALLHQVAECVWRYLPELLKSKIRAVGIDPEARERERRQREEQAAAMATALRQRTQPAAAVQDRRGNETR